MTTAYNVVVHAVPGTICRHHVAIVMAGARTVALVYKHTIESISMFVNRVLGSDVAIVAYIWLDIKYLREYDVTSYLSAHHTIPVYTSITHLDLWKSYRHNCFNGHSAGLPRQACNISELNVFSLELLN